MVGSPKRKRVVACDLCRARKVRCNGETPCDVCLVREEHCEITHTSKKRKITVADDAMDERLARLEALVQEPIATRIASDEQRMRPSTPGNALSSNGENQSAQHERGVFTADEASVKYLGPHGVLSACSKQAIQWVSTRLKNDNYQPVVSRLLHLVSRPMFQRPGLISRERKPDPPADEARQYVDAYFSEAPEVLFGAVRRDLFQPRFEAHLAGSRSDINNPAIYAIRNAIFASGCRIKMAAVVGYSKAMSLASGWFENAMSVHTELLYMPTTIIAVTALVIMTYFAEDIAGPWLQYMLSSCALRLACAKGLHREPATSWAVNEMDNRHRHGIFWAAYCADQSIAASSGRPPTIPDDFITCKAPATNWDGPLSNELYCMAMVNLQQIHARVSKFLLADIGLLEPDKFLAHLRELLDQVEMFRLRLKPAVDLETASDSSHFPSNSEHGMTIGLRYKYYEVLFRIHTSIVYPWLRPAWTTTQRNSVSHAVEDSTAILSRISRQVLMSTTDLRLDPSCRFWTAVIVPLYACIDVFVRLTDDIASANWQSDFALLELGVAHFARIELYSDGKHSIPFARELAQLANDLRSRASNDTAIVDPIASTSTGLMTPATRTTGVNEVPSTDALNWPEGVTDIIDLEWWNDDFDNWNLDGWI